jgi:ribosomal protein L11 methyltransferase
MIQQMLEMDFKDKKVLDMGCGTSVLAIYAKMKGAKDVLAIDIDEWSVENSKENAERNNVELRIELGTAENLGKEKFDIILANINRNILISDIPTYVKDMNQGSELLLSGLCFFDVEDILEVCTEQGLNSKTNNSAKNGAVCFWRNKIQKRSIEFERFFIFTSYSKSLNLQSYKTDSQ